MVVAQDLAVYTFDVPGQVWPTSKEGRGRQPVTPTLGDMGSSDPIGKEEESTPI